MKSMLLLYALMTGVLGVGVLACQANVTGGDRATTDTGLEGRVLRGPTCAGPQTDQPCPDEPFSAWFDVFDDQERHVARFQTDEEGHFDVSLRPGTYTIIPDETAPILLPHTQPQTVTVTSDQRTTVTLNFDTGIR